MENHQTFYIFSPNNRAKHPLCYIHFLGIPDHVTIEPIYKYECLHINCLQEFIYYYGSIKSMFLFQLVVCLLLGTRVDLLHPEIQLTAAALIGVGFIIQVILEVILEIVCWKPSKGRTLLNKHW